MANSPERGNRIDNRARGNAAQLHEKYRNLARDTQTQGDRVMTEYYLQFADHYFRVLNESRARFEEQNPNQAQQRRPHQNDDFDDNGFDGDGGDDGGEMEVAQREPRRFDREPRREAGYDDGEPPVRDGNGNGYNRDNQERGQQQERGNQDRGQQDRGQQERGAQDRDNRDSGYNRDNRQAHQPRDNRPAQADRDPPRPAREPHQPRDARQPVAIESPPAQPAVEVVETEMVRPRRGRPPRRPEAVVAPTEPQAQIEVDRLPPAFAPDEPNAPAPSPRARRQGSEAIAEEGIRAVEGEPVEPAPRRRRLRRDSGDEGNVAA